MRRQPLIFEFVHRPELSLADAARRVALIASAGIVLAILSAWLGAECFGQGPPVWGQQPAWRSPGINNACPTPAIDAKAFYDSIGGDQLAAAVVRVSVQDRNGQNSLGSGTLVEVYEDGSGLVVTNNHVVAYAASSTAGSVAFRSGERSRFTIRDVDPIWDIAVLEIAAPASVKPVQMADAPPERGASLMIAGYGAPSQGLLFQAGQFVKRGAPRIGYPFEQLALQPCQARQGDSGGPVFDSRGRMAACLWGASPGETIASPCTRILALLRAVRQRLGRRLRGESPGRLVPIQRPEPQLPGPIAGQPSAPAEPAPPQNDSNPSGSAAGGELATILDRIKELEGKLSEQAKEAAPSIADEGKQLAEDAIQAAAPSLIAGLAEKLLPLALKTLGVTLGGATGLGGVGLAGWGAIKLLKGVGGVIARRRSAAKAAKAVKTAADQQGTASGTTPTGAGIPQVFDPQALVASEMSRIAAAIKNDVQTQIDAKLSIIGKQAQATATIETAPAPPPTIVQQQVENPNYIALKKAIETLAESPAMIPVVNKIYSYRDQLLTQAKPR